MSFPQNVTSLLISIIGTIVTILLLTGFVIWLGKEIITKKPIIIKAFLIILFICMILTFLPQLL